MCSIYVSKRLINALKSVNWFYVNICTFHKQTTEQILSQCQRVSLFSSTGSREVELNSSEGPCSPLPVFCSTANNLFIRFQLVSHALTSEGNRYFECAFNIPHRFHISDSSSKQCKHFAVIRRHSVANHPTKHSCVPWEWILGPPFQVVYFHWQQLFCHSAMENYSYRSWIIHYRNKVTTFIKYHLQRRTMLFKGLWRKKKQTTQSALCENT